MAMQGPERVTLALGVAIGKLLLRWAALNDTAEALEDDRAGFNAIKALRSPVATDPVSTAITDLLEQRLAGVHDRGRREQMKIAVLNVADVFTRLTDADIVAAAQDPQGFPGYLAAGPGRTLLANTEEALTPFTRQVMDAGAAVFAELAPQSGRFAPDALLIILDQVEAVTAGVTGLHEVQTVLRVGPEVVAEVQRTAVLRERRAWRRAFKSLAIIGTLLGVFTALLADSSMAYATFGAAPLVVGALAAIAATVLSGVILGRARRRRRPTAGQASRDAFVAWQGVLASHGEASK